MLLDLNVVVVSCENKDGQVDNGSNPFYNYTYKSDY